MQLTVPFFRQKTDYTCGPACLRMLFAFHKRRLSEGEIAREAGSRERTGTARKAMLKVARMQGFTCRMTSNAAWKDVMENLKHGMPVLINYREPSCEEGHYALVIGIRGKDALLHDPWNGMQFKLPVTDLKRRWLGHRTREENRGWMMTVMPSDVSASATIRTTAR